MRNLFPLYYHLSEDEKRQLFNSKDCYFVFDTNALLDIYRLGKETADKVLILIDKYKDRIVIPKHVAYEYHKNMLDIITEICGKYKCFLDLNSSDSILNGLIDSLKLQNEPSIKRKVTRYLSPALEGLLNDVKSECDYIQNQFKSWELQNKLSDALGSLVLGGYTDEEIKEIEEKGKKRYATEIPPGYKDAKEKSSNIYGDYIIWCEILRFAKDKRCSIIFIGRDMKEDWLQKLHGMTCGPRQELLDEFHEYSPKGKFYIYSLDQFLSFANETDKVMDDSDIIEVKELITARVAEKNEDTARKSSIPTKKCYPDNDKSESVKQEDITDRMEESPKSRC